MKRALVVLVLLVAISCSRETIIQSPTDPGVPVPEPTLISGAWQAIVTSSTVPNAVWTMTLTQEQTVAFGEWVDDVNDYKGQVNITVTADNLAIGTISIRTIASCTQSVATCGACVGVATVRGTVAPELMVWDSAGWPECAGAPIQVKMSWRK